VTNFEPDAETPQRGRWVIDQVEEIRRLGPEVELFSFPLGRREYLPATRRLREVLRHSRFDLVHAHYGLPGWCARLAGARPLVVTFHGTDVRHPLVGSLSRRLARRAELGAGVSRALFGAEGGRPGLAWAPGGSAVLPCGPDLSRFTPIPKAEARRKLGLDPDQPFLFFPANPRRPEKRHDRAVATAQACGATLHSGGSIEPELMPMWLNAANAVLVTSDYEGFGMACIEALACEVPVLSTPVGVAPFALAGVEGALCAPFENGTWRRAALEALGRPDPRVEGSRRAGVFSSARMARRVVEAYRDVLRNHSPAVAAATAAGARTEESGV
jgi:glycosyltransferase involved in cell wall biosynthesis